MRLDLGSFAFNFSFEGGGGTPSWGTALGQGEGYKITCENRENIILGMTRQFYPKENVYCPFGKGGKIYCGKDTDEMQQAALFNRVNVNDKRINYPFIMLLQVEDSTHHKGRLSLKYSPKIYIKENDVVLYSNEKFIKEVYSAFGISDHACWFVYDINVEEQETLRLSAVFVDSNNNRTYKTVDERKHEWMNLIPAEKKSNYVGTVNAGKDSLQMIFYGAPGTGKSYKIEDMTSGMKVVRTTFHPDSDYSTFVGAYKPTMKEAPIRNNLGQIFKKDGSVLAVDKDYNMAEVVTEKRIAYEFVAQAFLKAYVEAWRYYPEPQYLVIEEINRGNCAQIFGDLFQLLDRDTDGFSGYSIDADDDIRRYIEEQNILMGNRPGLEADLNRYAAVHKLGTDGMGVWEMVRSGRKLLLPKNLYIWATMNTSDQSLFPIDSAFKRRWDWKYFSIADAGLSWIIDIKVEQYKWWSFVDLINKKIKSATESEDKKIGYFFVNAEDNNKTVDTDRFVGKVLFYFWNDVLKDYPLAENDVLLKDGNGSLSFESFYDANGAINKEKVKLFLDNLGTEKVDSKNTASTPKNEPEKAKEA